MMEQEIKTKPRRKWYWRVLRIFLWVFGSLLTLLLLAWLLVVIFQNQIEQKVVSRVNEELNTEIKVEDIDVSLFHHFPMVSVIFNNVSASDATPQKTGNLFSASWVSLEFDLIDLITGDYNIRQIGMSRGTVDLKVFADGSDNFHLIKADTARKSSDDGVSFRLNRIYINDVQASYSDERSRQKYQFQLFSASASGDFRNDDFTMRFSSSLRVDTIHTGGMYFIPGSEAEVDATLSVNSAAQTVSFTQAEIAISEVLLLAAGQVLYHPEKQWVDISVNAGQSDLNQFISLLPQEQQNFFDDFSHKGTVSLQSNIKGSYSDGRMPAVEVNMSLQDGFMEQSENGIALSNIRFKSRFSCTDFSNEKTWMLSLRDFSAELDKKKVSGAMQIRDFSEPRVKLQAKGELSLEKILEWGRWEDIETMSGTVMFDVQYESRIKDLNRLSAKDFTESRSDGTLNISKAVFKSRGMESSASIHHLKAVFTNTDLDLDSFNITYGKSDFSGYGVLRNVIPYLLSENERLSLRADIHSNNLVVNDLFPEDQSAEKASKGDIRFVLPDDVVAVVGFSADKLSYNKFGASKVKARVHLSENRLLAENVSMNTLGGSISGEGSCDTRNKGKVLVSCDARLKGIDVREAFIVFDEFGQKDLTSENLRGRTDVSLQFKAGFSESLVVDEGSIVANADITINDGQLVGYAPINDLQEIIKGRDFSDIQFEKLICSIAIADRKISIPKTEIRSNVLNMKLSGTHTFDNAIEYHLEVKYSEVKKSSSNGSGAESEYGYVVEDGVGNPTIFILVTGTVDDPKYKQLDKKAMQEKIKQDIKTEKKNLKKILNEEFGLFKKDSTLQKTEPDPQQNTKFQIEWEEE